MPATDRLTAYVAKSGNRVMRPRDLDYQDATLVLRLLLQRDAVYRLAQGYYLVPPDSHRGVRSWRPSIEAVALGIAVADYSRDEVALMGVSAARLRGVPARAVATGIIAIPKSHRPKLMTAFGEIHFVSRKAQRLDLERAHTDVVEGWATTPEQTILDVARRPTMGDISPTTASEIVTELALQADWELVKQLAHQQRARPALARASWLAAAVTQVEPIRGRSTPSLGMKPIGPVDAKHFGITG